MDPVSFDWFVPSSGDNQQLIRSGTAERSGIEYLRHLARVAEEAGYDGVMLPTGVAMEDGALLAALLAQDTRQLKLMVSFRAGPELPSHFAQRIATLQAMSQQRIQVCLFNGSESEQRSYGDFVEHDVAYERAGEFLDIARQLWAGHPVQHASRHYLVNSAGLSAAVSATPRVHVFGASKAAEKVVAQHADVHMMWGEPPDLMEERIARTRKLAREAGRDIRLGLRIGIITQETDEGAWGEAAKLLHAVPSEIIDQVQQEISGWNDVGLARMQRLHDHGRVRDVRALEIYPNLWAGSCLVGSITTLVGSYKRVRERIHEFVDLGFSTFVLSGYPNLGTMQRVAQYVL